MLKKNKIIKYSQNDILFFQPRCNTYPQENDISIFTIHDLIPDLDFNIMEYYLLDKIVNHKLLNNSFIKSYNKVIIINIFFINILFNNIIFNR